MKLRGFVFWLVAGGFGGEILSLFGAPFNKYQFLLIVGGAIGLCLFQVILFYFLRKITIRYLFSTSIGFLLGLVVITLLIDIFRPCFLLLPVGFQTFIYFWSIILSVNGARMVINLKWEEICHWVGGGGDHSQARPKDSNKLKILDTSAIIDGRIADLCKTGFLEGVLIVPNFVLIELQKIADSAEQLRRNRGRRGLDLLHTMQKEKQVVIRIVDRDFEDLSEVDTKLLRLARELGAKVITNDYNLNKVAELYGVEVLNINDLSNAIKQVVIPGEEMLVQVMRDGKEYGQGIGYLADGTMIVVEGGKNYIGTEISVLVTSVLQTSAGRMIFAKPKEYFYPKAMS